MFVKGDIVKVLSGFFRGKQGEVTERVIAFSKSKKEYRCYIRGEGFQTYILESNLDYVTPPPKDWEKLKIKVQELEEEIAALNKSLREEQAKLRDEQKKVEYMQDRINRAAEGLMRTHAMIIRPV